MAQCQCWAAMGEDRLPLPVPVQVTLGQAAPATSAAHRCGGTGGEDVAEHTIAVPTLTCPIMATAGTSTARGAAARLLPCPSNKHTTSSNTNQMRKWSLCFPPLCCFLLFSSAF